MADLADRLNAALAGRYQIQRELGTGGMATVFLAQDLRHKRSVAIKVLRVELATVLGPERFLREIEIAAGLNHPHILPLYDSGVADGLLYYVMPYAEGESLRQRLAREKQLPLADALRIAREVADALDYAHRRGVVHRDIKPENILLSGQHALVADFGIARAVAAAGGETLTATGAVIGTPAYMSPEQLAGSNEVDGRADQYGLGCVLYEMLAGQPPFTGPTAESLAHQHLSVAPRAVRELRTSVPISVSTAIRRALAKPAADRFGSVAEFASVLMVSAEPTPTPTPTPAGATIPADTQQETQAWPRTTTLGVSPAKRRLFMAAVGAAAIALALAVWKFGSTFTGDRASDPSKKAWVLVAEFDGAAGDSSLVAATRDMVTAALDQSEIVATVPRDQILEALRSAEKPASTRVDAELARELAYRSAVRTVLEGRVGRLGKGYSIVLRLVNADSARVLLSLSDVARDEEALIPTVDRIAKRLRERLGEQHDAIRATRPLEQTTTPSLEAYRAHLEGQRLLNDGDSRTAITWLRRALALDPDFARAWLFLGFALANLGEPDSALAAFQEADARPHRLRDVIRLYCKASIASLNGDVAGTLAVSDQQIQLQPESPYAHNNRGVYLAGAGRVAEALESVRTAEKVSPFGPSQGVLGNQFVYLLALGRVDEARMLVPRFKGSTALEAPMDLAAAAGQWSTAESLAISLLANPSAGDGLRRSAATIQAANQASRGEVRAADQTLRQAQSSVTGTSGERIRANRTRWDRLRLATFSRGVAVDPGSPGAWDSTTAGLVVRAVWAAAAGDTVLPRRLLVTIRKRSGPDLARQGFLGPGMIEGWLAARAGRWAEVLQHLGPAALQGEAQGYTLMQSAPLVRWLVAEAYEHLDRPDSAAAYFERAISPPPEGGTSITQPRTAFSFGHRRLVLLYARMGRLDEARRHWEIFSATFTRPDPEMRPLVEEARAALEAAEAMARSARR